MKFPSIKKVKEILGEKKSDEKSVGFTILIVLLVTVVSSALWYKILQSFWIGLGFSLQQFLHNYPLLLFVRPDFWILIVDFFIGALIYYKISEKANLEEYIFPVCKIGIFISMTFPLYSDVVGQLFLWEAFSTSYLVLAVIFASLAFAVLKTKTMAGLFLFIPPMFFFYFTYLLDLMNVPMDGVIFMVFLYYGIATIIDLLIINSLDGE